MIVIVKKDLKKIVTKHRFQYIDAKIVTKHQFQYIDAKIVTKTSISIHCCKNRDKTSISIHCCKNEKTVIFHVNLNIEKKYKLKKIIKGYPYEFHYKNIKPNSLTLNLIEMMKNSTIFLGTKKFTPRKNEKNTFFATKQSPKRLKTCVKKHQLVIKN